MAISSDLGLAYSRVRRYGDAVTHLERTVAAHPSFAEAHRQLGYVWLLGREFERAAVHLKRAIELGATSLEDHGALGYALAKAERSDDALHVLKALREENGTRELHPVHLAPIYAGLGRNERALALLHDCWTRPDDERFSVFLTFAARQYPELWEDARFQESFQRLSSAAPASWHSLASNDFASEREEARRQLQARRAAQR